MQLKIRQTFGIVIGALTALVAFEVSAQETDTFFRFNGEKVFEKLQHPLEGLGYLLVQGGLDFTNGQFRVIREQGNTVEFFIGDLNGKKGEITKKILTQITDEKGRVKNIDLKSVQFEISAEKFRELFTEIESLTDKAKFESEENETDFSTMYYIGVISESGIMKSAWSCRVKPSKNSDIERFEKILEYFLSLNGGGVG